MSLKRQQDVLATFSMASMTDVIFLLLVFFMVTSTFIFPTALEVNLPQSSEQTPLKPSTRVYLEPNGALYIQYADGEPIACKSNDELVKLLAQIKSQDPESAIALYADTEVAYGEVVKVLNLGADNDLRMVLATTPRPQVSQTSTNEQSNTTTTTDNSNKNIAPQQSSQLTQ